MAHKKMTGKDHEAISKRKPREFEKATMQNISKDHDTKEVKTLGERIILKRVQQGMSQKDLAELCDIHQSTLSVIERNQSKNNKNLDAIAAALSVSENWLIGVTTNESPTHRLQAEEIRQKQEWSNKKPASKASEKIIDGSFFTVQLDVFDSHALEGSVLKVVGQDELFTVVEVVRCVDHEHLYKKILLQKGRVKLHPLSKEIVKCLELA